MPVAAYKMALQSQEIGTYVEQPPMKKQCATADIRYISVRYKWLEPICITPLVFSFYPELVLLKIQIQQELELSVSESASPSWPLES